MAGNNSGSKSAGIAGISAARYLGDLAEELNQVGTFTPATGKQKGITSNVDWRARLRPKNGGRDLFWRGADESANAGTDYLLKPLFDAGGLVWQYTPDVLVSAQVNYNQTDFHGQNYPVMTYKNTIPPSIPITSDFSANTVPEARYLLAVMHFCKVATKSFGGDAAVASGFYGTPPPVLLFEYLGHHGFNKVPVVLTSYSMNLAADVDYVPVATGVNDESVTYVPTMCNFQINLQPTYTPHKLRKRFDLQSFTTGKNYKDGFI
ncbi:hypothetical protein N9I01_00515 [bacterium]|nr:hypothetical protein [bacterium]